MNQAYEINAITQANNAIYHSFRTLDFRGASVYLTEDCDYITFNGMHLKGREEYIMLHERLMNNFMFRGARLHGHIEQVRFLNENVAIVVATGAIRFRWQKRVPESRQSVNTTVWVKSPEGQWQMSAFHNCRIKKMNWLARWIMGSVKKKPDEKKPQIAPWIVGTTPPEYAPE
ncbi:SgcJ/EcaC family oxidoreductase [Chitinophaga sp. CC14]|uniref:YybH family protein n=1 Tax=Chitinophaga sp. CC14 TaxID=3029199 RepID=UPI003B769862